MIMAPRKAQPRPTSGSGGFDDSKAPSGAGGGSNGASGGNYWAGGQAGGNQAAQAGQAASNTGANFTDAKPVPVNPVPVAQSFAGKNVGLPGGMPQAGGYSSLPPSLPSGSPTFVPQQPDTPRNPTNPHGPEDQTQPGSNNLDDLNKLYQDILAQHDAGWGQQQQLLQNQMGAGQRRADLMNARMGRSIGGGYAGLQGQAMVGGMNAMSQAKLKSDEQRRGVMLDWLDRQLEEKRRQEERGWQQADNAADAQAADDTMFWQQILSNPAIDLSTMPQMMEFFKNNDIDGYTQWAAEQKRRADANNDGKPGSGS